MWSVFECECITKIDKKYQWIKELRFFMGDLSKEDFKNDWRFCEVDKKRKQVKFLGLAETEFPVRFPLILDNGTIIEDIYFHRKIKDEEEI